MDKPVTNLHQALPGRGTGDFLAGPHSDLFQAFASLPATAATHFSLYYYAAVLELLGPTLTFFGSQEEAFKAFPFLKGYLAELAGNGLEGLDLDQARAIWRQTLLAWEAGVEGFLPLRALQQAAGLSQADLILLMMTGLGEEDPRFGELFESLQGIPGQRRPTRGLLMRAARPLPPGFSGGLPPGLLVELQMPPADRARSNGRSPVQARGLPILDPLQNPAEADLLMPGAVETADQLRRLEMIGLLEAGSQEAIRPEWTLQPPPVVWDAMSGLYLAGVSSVQAQGGASGREGDGLPLGSNAGRQEADIAGGRFIPPGALIPLEELILPDEIGQSLAAIEQMLDSPQAIQGGKGEVQALVVRGQGHNGRHALLGALARQMGRGVLMVDGSQAGLIRSGERSEDLPHAYSQGNGPARPWSNRSWQQVGLLSTLLNAMPVVAYDLGAGETAEIPALSAYLGPLGVILPRQGGITGSGVERALTLTLEIPDRTLRRRHWQRALGLAPTGRLADEQVNDELDEISDRFRLSSGNIYRAAALAKSYAALRGRAAPAGGDAAEMGDPGGRGEASVCKVIMSDVQAASRALNRQALDTLAAYLPLRSGPPLRAPESDSGFPNPLRVPEGAGGKAANAAERTGYQPGQAPASAGAELVVDAYLRQELDELETRCRFREQLQEVVSPAMGVQLNAGVRALFSGPSGTGKTLAARLLANSLNMDLYRLDLSALVNKYIGETEKNLNQVFARAEELGVILLLDEGDALLTQRTNVQTSNDRYANLETNYLLQRLETFEGILIVTTNAGDRIDQAFERRMDVVIHFHPPDIEERWGIWQLHLPAVHAVDGGFLAEVVERCDLSGAQIRSAALFACLLALDDSRRNQPFAPEPRSDWDGAAMVKTVHLEAAIQREYRKIGAVCPLRSRQGWK